MMQVDPFQNANPMFMQSNHEDQNPSHVFSQYNYPSQGNTAPSSAPGSQQPYVTYANQSDPKGGVNVVQPPPPTAYMQQPPPMFYNNYPPGQQGLQPAQQGGEYFQQSVPGGMRYANQQAPLQQQQQQHHQGGRGMRGNRWGRGGRFYQNNNGPNMYMPGGMPHSQGSYNAVPERTPTVRLLNPNTNRVMHIKMNRISCSAADVGVDCVSPEIAPTGLPKNKICTACLSSQPCIRGNACPFVHISDLRYAWEPVDCSTTEVDEGMAYLPGFVFRCYDPSQTHYLSVPSESMLVTKGSSEYIMSFNQHGENFKSKYVLCEAFMDPSRVCDLGEECTNLHCTEKDLERLFMNDNTSNTHLNNASLMANVPRLPETMLVRAYDQNSLECYHDYEGSQVLVTNGARSYVKSLHGDRGQLMFRRRMQHCAHFRLKDMCRLGESCRFLHVLSTPEELQTRTELMNQGAAAAAAKFEMRQLDDRRGMTHNPYA